MKHAATYNTTFTIQFASVLVVCIALIASPPVLGAAIDWDLGLRAGNHWDVPADNPTGNSLSFSMGIVPGMRVGWYEPRSPSQDRYILSIGMDPTLYDGNDLMGIKAAAPGSVSLATYDKDAYIEVVDVRYTKGIETRWRTYVAPTDWEKHKTAVYQKSVETLVSAVPVLGTLSSGASLLNLAFVDQTPNFLVASQLNVPVRDGEPIAWNVAPSTRYQNQDSRDDVSLYAEASQEFVDAHRYYDVSSKHWHALTTGEEFIGVSGLEVDFILRRDSGSTRRLPLFVRAVLPILWLDGSPRNDGSVDMSTHTYFAELEWMTAIPAQTTADEPEPLPRATLGMAWAGQQQSSGVTDANLLLGAPDGKQAVVAERNGEVTVSAFGLGGQSIRTAELAEVLGVPESTLARADVLAFEYNGGRNAPFESSQWTFSDGTASTTATHDFNTPDYTGLIVAGGSVSKARFGDFFRCETPSHSGEFAFLLFNLPDEIDHRSEFFRVEIRSHGAGPVNTPDIEAIAILE